MTIEQLKALKCDHYESIAKSQQQLQVINQEILRRKLEENKKLTNRNESVLPPKS